MITAAFRDQVVIVTGASAGIGRAIAIQLAGQGAKVVLVARRVELLEQAATECRQAGGEALAIPADVANESQCKALVEKTVAVFGRVDMLVNNAGLNVLARVEDYSDLGLFKHVMDVNFYGAVHCTYHALPHLIQSRGRIVAVSSMGGKAPAPYNSPYIASKFAMHGFFDSLRIEMVKYGVSVTIVCPYWVVTGFHEAQLDKNGVPRGSRGRAIYTEKMMSADRCAEITLQAAHKRKRELMMGPVRLVAWLKLLAPRLIDRYAIAFLKASVQREQKNSTQV
jgi:short-subunit dehydrogenase